MKKSKEKKIFYYKSFKDDVVESKNQDYKLKDGYKWIKTNIFYRLCSNIIYAIARVFGIIYCKFFLHVKYENKEVLKKYKKQGYFIFGNHTQPMGDVFIPAGLGKRIYVLVSPANLGVTGIGPFLPMLGALPKPDSLKDMKKLTDAINFRINKNKCVVIYPEAHVWPYYTKIRPFSSASFRFPVNLDAPSFVMTTTYYKRKYGDKPGIKVYIDGPFMPDNNLSKKEREEKLHNDVYSCMSDRSMKSTYEYIEYKEVRE